MNITGIIAEYNPFHNGHKYLIDEARKESDAVVVAMSQEVMQRGSFSPFEKSFRTKSALLNGADLIVGMSNLVSSNSAGFFAEEGIRLLSKLGINKLAFGIEGYDRNLFEKVASVLSDEPEIYRNYLKRELKKGLSFPKARMMALENFLDTSLSPFLSKANNILALEYRRALLNYDITPLEVMRKGATYHELDSETNFMSASGIRHALNGNREIEQAIPYPLKDLKEAYSKFDETFYFKSLLLKLITDEKSLVETPGINRELINRIKKALRYDFQNLNDFINFLKTKNITWTRLERALLNFLLGIKESDYKLYQNTSPYIRVLAANSKGREILKKTTVRLVDRLKVDP